MKIRSRDIKNLIFRIIKSNTGVYAAQSTYFFILSMIPIMLLLLTIVQYTPVTKADVMTALVQIIPEANMQGFLVNIVNEVYNQSRTVIPITAILAIWSAGKGVLSMCTGLNWAYKREETRNYLVLRLRASLYTVIFVIMIALALLLQVFGNSIILFLHEHFLTLEATLTHLLSYKSFFSFVMFYGFALLVYRFLPNGDHVAKMQIPGALFAAAAWNAISAVISIYLVFSPNFSGLYGSMTAIILVMLWMYFCMYAILIGGHINAMYEEKKAGK